MNRPATLTKRPPVDTASINGPRTSGGEEKRPIASLRMKNAIATSVAACTSAARISTR